MFDKNKSLFQLSHEAVHCLFPSGSRKATVLEEGMATWFSLNFDFPGYTHLFYNNVKYDNAEYMTRVLMLIDKDAIKKLREKDFHLKNISHEDILNICPDFPESYARNLCLNFYQWDGQIPS